MFASAIALALALSLTSAVTFTDYRTANGMRVLLAPDPSAPLVAVSLTYDFGSRTGGSIERAEQVLDEEIARIQRDGVTEAELALARSQESDYWKQVLATPRGRAETLTRFSIYYQDPELINSELKAILAMTAADVQRVARKYMKRDNRAVVVTLNKR